MAYKKSKSSKSRKKRTISSDHLKKMQAGKKRKSKIRNQVDKLSSLSNIPSEKRSEYDVLLDNLRRDRKN